MAANKNRIHPVMIWIALSAQCKVLYPLRI